MKKGFKMFVCLAGFWWLATCHFAHILVFRVARVAKVKMYTSSFASSKGLFWLLLSFSIIWPVLKISTLLDAAYYLIDFWGWDFPFLAVDVVLNWNAGHSPWNLELQDLAEGRSCLVPALTSGVKAKKEFGQVALETCSWQDCSIWEEAGVVPVFLILPAGSSQQFLALNCLQLLEAKGTFFFAFRGTQLGLLKVPKLAHVAGTGEA